MKLFEKKARKEKNPLLQTYFVSLLSLILCVGMFMGTSFAWFTSDVTSADNQIYVGSLDLTLEHKTGVDAWTKVEGGHKILNPDIFWEPGYTAIEWLKLTNTGDLSFHYRLKMASIDPNNVLGEIGQYFVVYACEGTYNKPASFEELQADASWKYVGTLTDVMYGKSILAGKMDKSGAPSTEFGFAIHLNENADASIMKKTLAGITVKLEAWQMGQESDAFGNDYDRMVSTAEELTAAFAEGGKIILRNDITIPAEVGTVILPEGKAVTLNLNGYTLSREESQTGRMLQMSSNSSLTINAEGSLVSLTGLGLVEFVAGVKNASVTLNGGTYDGDIHNGALVRLREGNENIVLNMNDVTATLINGWVVSSAGMTGTDSLKLNVQGGSYKALKGFELYNTVANIADTKIDTFSWALLCGDATVKNTEIIVSGAGTIADDPVPAAVAVMGEKTLSITGGSITVSGNTGAVAALVCNSGGHLKLDGVSVTTDGSLELYRDDNVAQGKGYSSSVTMTNVTHDGVAVTLP